MTEEFSHGRSASGGIVSYREVQNKNNLEKSLEDDEHFKIKIDGYKFIIRYDAPREEDKTKGHLSFWVHYKNDEYKKCYLYTGDDKDVYYKYIHIVEGDKNVYDYVNRNKIKNLNL